MTVLGRLLSIVWGVMMVILHQGLAHADGRFEPLPRPFIAQLSNGMSMIVITDRRAPVAYHAVYYKVGAADEEAGKTGLAHFLEHLMFKGTKTIPDAQFSKIIADMGGRDNAFTSADATAYYQRIPIAHLEKVMAMEADRMVNLQLFPEDVASERDVVLEERSTRTDSRAVSLFYEELNATVYRNHPYGRPLIGWRSEIEKLNLEDAMAFYKKFYHPRNAVLVVAGDISGEDALALAEATYGHVTSETPVMAHQRPTEPPLRAARVVSMTDKRVGNPQFTTYFSAPSYFTATGVEAHALEILARYLGNDPTGLLHREFVRQRKTALSLGVYYMGRYRDHGHLVVYGVPVEGVSPQDLHHDVMEFLQQTVQETFEPERIELDKKALAGGALLGLDSVGALGDMYARTLTLGGDVDDVSHWPVRIKQVTAEIMAKVAQEVVKTDQSVTGFLMKDEQP